MIITYKGNVVQKSKLWNQQTWAQILTLLLSNCEIKDTLQNFSKSLSAKNQGNFLGLFLRIRKTTYKKHPVQGFPGDAVVKNPPANTGTRVRALVREDPTCCGATKPVCHNY